MLHWCEEWDPADYYSIADICQEGVRVLQLMSQGTRCLARQMEIEQQLSTLIIMAQAVQEQQAGQQELCRGLECGTCYIQEARVE